MKRNIVSIALMAGMVFLAACSATGTQQGTKADLTGKVWVLTDLGGKPPVKGSAITIEFTEDGKVGGSAGCNQYAGTYTTSGNTIQISENLATTMMACEQPLMDQETAYTTALGTVKSFSVKSDILTLSDASGKAVATYKAQSQSLSGTSWNVMAYNNGKQAVTSVIIGTTLTADFGSDGNLAGNAGCNTYNGPYKVDGNNIKIGPLASTMKACADPAGIMDQESQFLTALGNAATYRVEGSMMELRSSDGALQVQLQQK
jgi:heat shock protein HslJ